MYKINCVCLGNICRSPLAEAVLQREVERRGLQDRIQVESSGTSGWHKGELADPRMRAAAEARGIHITSRGDHFLEKHLQESDMVLTMDKQNYCDVLAVNTGKSHMMKVWLFRDFDPEGRGEVPDPYYGGAKGFDLVIDMAERTAPQVIDYVEDVLAGKNPKPPRFPKP